MRAAALALVAAAAAATAAPARPTAAQSAALLKSLEAYVEAKVHVAPTLNLSNIEVRGTAFPDCTPTVLVHGLGDAGHNAGMQSLAKSIETAYPGCYATAVDVGDGLLSFIQPIQSQVDELAAVVAKDAKLQQGFNIVGFSQGGLIARAFIQQYSSTWPVKNFVSICGVENGIFACPLQIDIIPFLCDLFESNPYDFLFNGSLPLSFSDYFVTWWDEPYFLSKNRFLPAANNLLPSAPNASAYKTAMLQLQNVVLSQATEDTVVFPYQSEQFGGYQFNPANSTSKSHPVTYNFTQGAQYTQDLLGLGTLYSQQKVTLTEFVGNHLQFSDQYWNDVIIPFLH